LTDHLKTVWDIAKYELDDDMTTVVNHLICDAFGRARSESNLALDSFFVRVRSLTFLFNKMYNLVTVESWDCVLNLLTFA
jgi:hypothetical protein